VVEVMPGDSLWSIARAYGTTPQAIADANGITLATVINPGHRLVVPGQYAAGGRDVGGAVAQTVTVQKGETLWTLARAHNTTPAAGGAAGAPPAPPPPCGGGGPRRRRGAPATARAPATMSATGIRATGPAAARKPGAARGNEAGGGRAAAAAAATRPAVTGLIW